MAITYEQLLQVAAPAVFAELGLPHAKVQTFMLPNGDVAAATHLSMALTRSAEEIACAQTEVAKIALVNDSLKRIADGLRTAVGPDPKDLALRKATLALLEFIRQKYPWDFKPGGRGYICPFHQQLSELVE